MLTLAVLREVFLPRAVAWLLVPQFWHQGLGESTL